MIFFLLEAKKGGDRQKYSNMFMGIREKRERYIDGVAVMMVIGMQICNTEKKGKQAISRNIL